MLWQPEPWEASRLGRFALRLEADYGVDLGRDYEALRTWSLEHLDTFWLEVWRELRLPAAPEPTVACTGATPTGPAGPAVAAATRASTCSARS